jgi:hypothetical protein
VSLGASLHFAAKWNANPFAANHVTSASFYESVDEKASLRASAQGAASCQLPKTPVGPPFNWTTEFQIGPLPVVIQTQLRFYISASGRIGAAVTTGVGQSFSGSAGVSYANGGFSPIASLQNTFSYDAPSASAGGNFVASVGPELTFLLYGLAGPQLSLTGGMDLEVDLTRPSSQPWWTLDASLQGGVALVIPILGLSWSKPDLVRVSKRLAQSSTPAPGSGSGGGGSGSGGSGGGGSGGDSGGPGGGSGGGGGGGSSPPSQNPSGISIGWSSSNPGWITMTVSGLSAGTYSYTCHFASGGDQSFSVSISSNPQTFDNGHTCRDQQSGDSVWVSIGSVSSNHITVPAPPPPPLPTFGVMNTSESPPDGVYFRNSPHTSDTDRVTGHGVYAGEQVQLRCYAYGDAVGPYHDTLWYYVWNVSRGGSSNAGYLNAHYINDGKAAGQVDAGVPGC